MQSVENVLAFFPSPKPSMRPDLVLHQTCLNLNLFSLMTEINTLGSQLSRSY